MGIFIPDKEEWQDVLDRLEALEEKVFDSENVEDDNSQDSIDELDNEPEEEFKL